MTIFQKSNLFALMAVCTLSLSCSYKAGDQANRNGGIDTVALDGPFFDRERIIVMVNDSIVFDTEIRSENRMKNINDRFAVPRRGKLNVSVQTFIDKKKYVDTSFVIPEGVHLRDIGCSICYPLGRSLSSLKNVEPDWGFLPPDSCKRYLSLVPDSIKVVKW